MSVRGIDSLRSIVLCVAVAGSASRTNKIVTPIAVTEVVVTPERITTPQGERLRFTATVRDDRDRLIADMPVEWSSADPDIVEIDQDGFAEAHTPGTTTIRASLGNVIGEGRITVVRLSIDSDGDDEADDDEEGGDEGGDVDDEVGGDVGGDVDDEEDEVNDNDGGRSESKKKKNKKP